MTIIRRNYTSRYAAFPNAIWEDGWIGIDEKGVLGYLLSRPPNWNVHLSHVARVMRVGKDRMQRIFRTLIAAGYVARGRIRNENGVAVALEYVTCIAALGPPWRGRASESQQARLKTIRSCVGSLTEASE